MGHSSSKASSSKDGSKTQDNAGKLKPFEPTLPINSRRVFAVLTSGGDAQGMNAGVRAVVLMALRSKCRVYFIREGYQGLIDDKDGDMIVEASWFAVSDIIHKGA